MNLCNPDLTYLYSTITYAYFNSIPYNSYNSNLHHIYCSLTVNVGIPVFTKRHYRHNHSCKTPVLRISLLKPQIPRSPSSLLHFSLLYIIIIHFYF